MKYERTARLKLKNKPLLEILEFGEKERRVFPELLKALKTPRRPQEFANKYGNVVYYLIHKMLKAGMIEKLEVCGEAEEVGGEVGKLCFQDGLKRAGSCSPFSSSKS